MSYFRKIVYLKKSDHGMVVSNGGFARIEKKNGVLMIHLATQDYRGTLDSPVYVVYERQGKWLLHQVGTLLCGETADFCCALEYLPQHLRAEEIGGILVGVKEYYLWGTCGSFPEMIEFEQISVENGSENANFHAEKEKNQGAFVVMGVHEENGIDNAQGRKPEEKVVEENEPERAGEGGRPVQEGYAGRKHAVEENEPERDREGGRPVQEGYAGRKYAAEENEPERAGEGGRPVQEGYAGRKHAAEENKPERDREGGRPVQEGYAGRKYAAEENEPERAGEGGRPVQEGYAGRKYAAEENEPERDRESRRPIKEKEGDIREGYLGGLEEMYPFEDDEMDWCLQMKPDDFFSFPMEYWHYGKNSFLLEGFYNYRHLLYAHKKGRNYIGVPGQFYRREQYLAGKFGFSGFKGIRKKRLKSGDYGYWLREL